MQNHIQRSLSPEFGLRETLGESLSPFVLFVWSFVCGLKRVLVGHWSDWSSSAIVLAAVSGRSAAGPVKSVLQILMAAAAYRIGYSGLKSNQI